MGLTKKLESVVPYSPVSKIIQFASVGTLATNNSIIYMEDEST